MQNAFGFWIGTTEKLNARDGLEKGNYKGNEALVGKREQEYYHQYESIIFA